MKFNQTGNIILVHKGALGDFILSWPCVFSIRKTFPQARVYWAGADDLLIWLNPLDIHKIPGSLATEIPKLYHTRVWPKSLSGSRVFWFGIHRVTTACLDQRLIFLTGVNGSKNVGFTETCFNQLRENGILPAADWKKAWNDYFGPSVNPEHVLIFPGSGNRKKNWPLKKYICLAESLQKQGLKTKFILGPVEKELGLNISGFDTTICRNYENLQELIKKALFVVGNDCGPMHLAGMFNVPGVALFGPTAQEIWRPHGIDIASSPRSCCPCSRNGVIECADPICMDEIKVDKVTQMIQEKYR
jgi:ADP-heptose:LPS heptosyltransferase